METRFMSSIKDLTCSVLPLCGLVLTQFAPAYGQKAKPALPVLCPAAITVNESTVPVPGWTVTPSKTQHAFERISVYNGKSGGQEYDLAPDDEKRQGNRITQVWMLKGYRTMNLFLRCRYRDTSSVLTMDLQPRLETCVQRFNADNKGRVAGESEMQCR
jgi:hypothetical protein